MRATVQQTVAVCLHPPHLKRTLTITVVVGTWLTLFNHGEALLSAGLTTALLGKTFLNYLTPFLVSNWGLVSRESRR